MIPVKIGILDDAGNDIPLQLEGEDSPDGTSRLLIWTRQSRAGLSAMSRQNHCSPSEEASPLRSSSTPNTPANSWLS